MKRNLLFFMIVSLLFLCGCNEPKHIFVASHIIDINDPIEVSIDELLTDFDTIRLEVNNESIMKNIIILHIMDGRFYIVSNDKKSIFIFEQNGKYVNKIEDRGQGPKEYIIIHDMQIDPVKKRIIITDAFSKRILVYDRDGKQTDVIQLKFFPTSIVAFNNGFININTFKNYNKNTQMDNYHVHFLDSIGNFVSSAINNNLKKDIDINSQFSIEVINDSEILYQPPLSNIVYKINDEEIIPYYELSNKSKYKLLNKKEREKFEYKYGKRNTLKEKEDLGYLLSWGEILEMNEIVSFIFRGEDICRHIFFDKNSKKSYFIDPKRLKGEKNTIEFFFNYIYAVNDDRFYIAPSEHIVAMLGGNISIKDETIKTFLNNLNYDSNPPLISFKIKFPD